MLDVDQLLSIREAQRTQEEEIAIDSVLRIIRPYVRSDSPTLPVIWFSIGRGFMPRFIVAEEAGKFLWAIKQVLVEEQGFPQLTFAKLVDLIGNTRVSDPDLRRALISGFYELATLVCWKCGLSVECPFPLFEDKEIQAHAWMKLRSMARKDCRYECGAQYCAQEIDLSYGPNAEEICIKTEFAHGKVTAQGLDKVVDESGKVLPRFYKNQWEFFYTRPKVAFDPLETSAAKKEAFWAEVHARRDLSVATVLKKIDRRPCDIELALDLVGVDADVNALQLVGNPNCPIMSEEGTRRALAKRAAAAEADSKAREGEQTEAGMFQEQKLDDGVASGAPGTFPPPFVPYSTRGANENSGARLNAGMTTEDVGFAANDWYVRQQQAKKQEREKAGEARMKLSEAQVRGLGRTESGLTSATKAYQPDQTGATARNAKEGFENLDKRGGGVRRRRRNGAGGS